MSTAASIHGRLDVTLDEGRYDRQELISWWDQQRLRDARVLVVGAGALGNELVKNLALLGVGTVVVVDLDTVENSNLSRGVLLREHDEGHAKAEVVATAARELNPEIRMIPIVGDIRRTLGLGVFRAVDVVLGGLDNREARLHVNQCCWKTSTPWVDGAIEGLMGVMRSFVPPDSACYECTLNERDYELLAARRACSLLTREQMLTGKVPTVATSGSIIAGLQAQEAIKLLHREGDTYEFAGRGFVFNGHTHDSYTVTYERREDCLSHDTYDFDAALRWPTTRSFADLIATHGDSDTVIDLEAELVVSLTCPSCDRTDLVRRPLLELTVEEAACPTCEAERQILPAHRVDRTMPELLEATPADVGLPAFDVVTLRSGYERRHVVVADEEDPFEFLAAH